MALSSAARIIYDPQIFSWQINGTCTMSDRQIDNACEIELISSAIIDDS